MHKLVSLELRTLHKGLATLSTDVDTGPVSVEVLPHCRVVTKHLGAPLDAMPTRGKRVERQQGEEQA